MGRRKTLLEDFATDSDSSGSDDELAFPSAPGHEPSNEHDAHQHRRKRRRTGRDAKEAAALGVFGSDSEDERPGRGKWKSRNLRNKNVAFVGQGQKVDDDDDDGEEEDETGQDGEEEEEKEKDTGFAGLRSGLGLGAGGGGMRGLGFARAGDDEQDESAEERPRLGLGGGGGVRRTFSKFTKSAGDSGASGNSTPRSFTTHAGLGFAAAAATPPPDGTMQDTTTPLGRGFVSSFAASRAQMPTLNASATETPPPVVRPSFTTPASAKGKGAGAAQPNPESFAARMMAKMGYVQGKGLGKTGEGRLTPVETKLRPQGAGLGAVREITAQEKQEARRAAQLRGEVLSDSEDEKRKKKAARKKGSAGSTPGATPRPKKEKTRFRTAEEISAAAKGLDVPTTLKNLIDLTGKETKLLPSAAGLMTQAPPSDAENMKIAKMARRDLESFTGEWRSLQDRKSFIANEEERLAREMHERVAELKRLQSMVDVVKAVQELSLDADSGLPHQGVARETAEAVVAQLEVLQEEFKGDIESHGLSEVAVAALHPMFKADLAHWSPLVDPFFASYLDYFRRLRKILNIRSKEDLEKEYATNGYLERSAKLTTPYESMILTLWLPKVRAAINNDWNVHKPTPVLTLLEAWHPVLPHFIQANILAQLILPKLRAAVSDWNPRLQTKSPSSSTSTSSSTKSRERDRRRAPPPHLWVFPWLPYLGTHMDELLRDIRTKLGVILSSWNIRTRPPEGLHEWRAVFGADKLETLLIRHVLPRLAAHLNTHFVVDPADQTLDALEDVLRWAALFRPSTFAKLLEAEFFPKWLNVLHAWLTAPHVVLTEVQQWYLFWQDVLPADIRAAAPVQDGFRRGLDMMNDAIDLGPHAASELPAPVAGPAPPIRADNKAHSAKTETPPRKRVDAPQETTFRDVVEDWCADHNLLLVPLRKAHEASGMPLFRITASASGAGGVLVYIKGDVVWMQDKKKVFTPVDLDEVLPRIEGR